MKRLVILLFTLFLLVGCGDRFITSSAPNSTTSSFDATSQANSSNITSNNQTTSTPSSSSSVSKIYYSATFLNYNGDVLYVDNNVLEGSIPEYKGETPNKEGTYKIEYEFIGWDIPLEPIYENTSYTALFEEKEIFYTVEELITFNGDYPLHYGKEVFLENVGIVSIYSEDTFTVTPVHNPTDSFSIEVKAKDNIKKTFTSNDVVTIVGILDVQNGRPFINNASVSWGYDGDQYSANNSAFIGTVEIKDREYWENNIDKKDSGSLYYSYMNFASIPDITPNKDISFYITFPGEDTQISDRNFYLIEARIPALEEKETEYVSSWIKQFKQGDGIYINMQIYYDNKLLVLLPYDLIDSSTFNTPYTHKNIFSTYAPVSEYIVKEYSKEYITFPSMDNEYTYNYTIKKAYETVNNSSMKYVKVSFYTYETNSLMSYLLDLYNSTEDFTSIGLDENGKYWIYHPYASSLDMHICIYQGFGKIIVEMHFLK